MSMSPLKPSDFRKVDQMQENLIAYFRVFAGLPDTLLGQEDVTWSVEAKGAPGNQVLRTRLPDDAIDHHIDEIINRTGQYADQVDWLVFPSCQPAHLGKRLEARGLQGDPA